MVIIIQELETCQGKATLIALVCGSKKDTQSARAWGGSLPVAASESMIAITVALKTGVPVTNVCGFYRTSDPHLAKVSLFFLKNARLLPLG